MKNSRSTADRIRPILQAMERSIDQARRRRMHDGDVPASASTPAPAPRQTPVTPAENGDDPDTPRRKARPKRSPVMRPYDGREYRAEAV